MDPEWSKVEACLLFLHQGCLQLGQALSQLRADGGTRKGFPMALAAPQVSVCDSNAAHPPFALIASWSWCLLLSGPWQAAFGSGSAGSPKEGVGPPHSRA